MQSRTQSDIVHKFGQVVGIEKARDLVAEAARELDLSPDGDYTTDECIQLCLYIETESSDITATVAHDVRDRFERQKHFQSLYSVLPDPAMIVTPEYDSVAVISANTASRSIFDFDEKTASDQTLGQVLDGVDRDDFEMEVYRNITSGNRFRTQITIRRQRGNRYFVTRFSPIEHDQTDNGTGTAPTAERGILVFTEITEQKRQQDDIEQLQQATEVMNRVLRHNLRNAMTTIVGRADHIKTATDDADALRSAEAVIRTGEKLIETSRNARSIQEFVKSMDTREVDIVQLIRTHVQQFRDRYGEVRIRTDLPESTTVIADDHLNTVIENVMKNAIEHNDKPTPVLDVSVRTDENEAVVELTDNGPGIPDHELDALNRGFETPLEHGTGLGIWVVSWIVRQYGGTVSFNDRTPEGTAVEIRLRTPK